MKISRYLLIFLAVLAIYSCSNKKDKEQLIIFHAGSLSVPIKQVVAAFNEENPDVEILTEAAGSRACARKIADLNRECDVMLSADYTVIDQLLIPDHTNWNIKFACNQMAIAFTEKSKYKDLIDSTNWYDILLKEDVAFGRSDPNSDPCGYRSVLVSKLAEIYYEEEGLANKLLAKDHKYIRPKETDLLALLETHTLDYIYIYRSVAVQHHLDFVALPPKINLQYPGYADYYSQVSVDISGKTKGTTITKIGEPMIYGVTVIDNAPNKEMAQKFVNFLLSEKGMAIMEKNGQPSIVPSETNTFNFIPEDLKKYALDEN